MTTNLYPGICPVFLLGLQLDIEWKKCQLSQKLLSIYFTLFNYILLYTYLMVLWSVFISAIYFNKIILKQENFQKAKNWVNCKACGYLTQHLLHKAFGYNHSKRRPYENHGKCWWLITSELYSFRILFYLFKEK